MCRNNTDVILTGTTMRLSFTLIMITRIQILETMTDLPRADKDQVVLSLYVSFKSLFNLYLLTDELFPTMQHDSASKVDVKVVVMRSFQLISHCKPRYHFLAEEARVNACLAELDATPW
jgi:hypothetical protein